MSVRLEALMALETVGVPGSCTGTSFTGRPLFTLSNIYNTTNSSYLCQYVVALTSTWPHLNSDVGLEEGEY